MQSVHKNAITYALIVSLGGFIFGLDIMLISGTFQYTSIEFGLTALQKGNIAAAPSWGALAALLCAGYLSERFGRKKTLLTIAALYIVSALWSAIAGSYFELFVARLIGGLAFTSLSLASMYIGEIAPPSKRGFLVGMNQFNIVIGIFVASLVNYMLVNSLSDGVAWITALGVSDANVWRWMLGFETVPAVIWFLLLLGIPESPRWLCLKGQSDKAKEALIKISANEQEATAQLAEIEASLDSEEKSRSYLDQVKDIFSKKMRLALYIGVFMAVVQALSGMNAILYFMPTILQQVGGGQSAFLQSVLINLIGMSFTLLSLLLIDKLGRRKILIGGLIVACAAMATVTYGFFDASYMIAADSLSALGASIDTSLLQPLVGVEFSSDIAFKSAVIELIGQKKFALIESELLLAATDIKGMLVLVSIVIFVCSYNFSLGPILWILLSEVFATKVRAAAITACGFIASIFGGILVPTMFPIQLESLGAMKTFLSYTVFCAIGLIVMSLITPETKGKSIEEIERELAAKSG